MQERRHPNALEWRLSCTKPSIHCRFVGSHCNHILPDYPHDYSGLCICGHPDSDGGWMMMIMIADDDDDDDDGDDDDDDDGGDGGDDDDDDDDDISEVTMIWNSFI